jgi:diguanylate cyclase (GGDEF)-like protein/PAS domain S-box-containing protein
MADLDEVSLEPALPTVLPHTPLTALLTFEALGRILDSNLGAVVSLIDLDTRLHYVNERFAKSFNMTPSEMIGKTLFDLYDEKHTSEFMPHIRRAFAGEVVTYDRLGIVVGSTGVWHTVAVMPWRDDKGNIIGAVSSSMRVHELKVTVEALRAANERLSSHMDNNPLAVIEFDHQLRITRCSSQIHEVLGIDAGSIIGRSMLEVVGDSERVKPLTNALGRLYGGRERRNRVEVALTDRDGRTVYSEWFNSALTDATGKVSSMMSLIQDTTARTLAEAQLQQIATHDPLTGLCNRRALTERLEQAVLRLKRHGAPLALLFIDLDGFKRVNDLHGHGAGDEVLCEVARRLLNITREIDVVARLGGDEFVVLAETDVSESSVNTMCERIMQSLEEPCGFSAGQAEIGASIGVALCPPVVSDALELMRVADAAMYEAKRAGKGCVWHASPAATKDVSSTLAAGHA